MTEKELAISQSPSATESTVIPTESFAQEKKEEDFQEILRQYDLPETKVSFLAILGHATWIEVVLMVVGSLMSIASGRYHPSRLTIGAALPLMVVVFGNLTNVFGGISSPGSPTVENVQTVDDFNSQVSTLALEFVYIGIGVLVASFLGTLFWTLSGERISRRIRGYIPSYPLT